MAQDNRAFLELCSHINKLLHRHDLVLLYKYMLNCDGEVLGIYKEKDNYRIRIKYWTPPNENMVSFRDEKDIILGPREEYGQER